MFVYHIAEDLTGKPVRRVGYIIVPNYIEQLDLIYLPLFGADLATQIALFRCDPVGTMTVGCGAQLHSARTLPEA